MHLAHHSKPHVQRHVIRVLWMVPIYALNAWVVRTQRSALHRSVASQALCR